MAERIRAHDWARTPLGPIDAWPQSLKTAVDLCLGSAFAGFVWWGPELVQLYNDAALAIVRAKHPQALGAPARQAWADVWGEVGALVEGVVATGQAVKGEDLPLVPDRGGARETAWFTFSYSAARDEAGAVAGVFITAIETTAKVKAERRLGELAGRAGLSADFRALFEAAPTPYVVLAPPDFQIVAVNDAYLRATMTERSEIVGRTLFDVFPENPDDPAATGAANLRASLERVLATRRADAMAVHKYDIRRPRSAGGGFVERWWSPASAPVLGADGEVALIIHRVEDVTEIVRLKSAGEAQDQLLRDQQDTIERLREAEEALRASEARHRLIVEGARDYAIFTADPEGRIESWSPGAEAVFGWSAGEVLGRPLDITFTPEDRERGEPEKERGEARATGSAPDVRWHLRRDGSRVFIDGTMRALDDGAGGVRGFLKIGQDVTQRRRVEEALRESEERHRLIVEGARDYAIFTTDPEGRIESWSPGAEAVYGWSAGEAVGQSLDMTFTPEDRAAGEPEKERAETRATGSAPDVRWHVRRDGARVFIEGVSRALFGPGGEPRGFLKVGQDVTQRRQTEEALRESQERFRTLVQNIRDYAIFLTDAGGVVTEWTEGAERVKGYTAEEAVGRHVSIFYTPENVAAGEVERELGEAAEHGRAEREGWRVRRDGARIWVNEIATAVRGADGRLVGYTKISRDLSAQREAQEALRRLNETLEQRVAERTAELAESNAALAAEIAERERAEASRSDVLRRLVSAEENERRRISRELHDSLGQLVTGLLLGLKALEREAGRTSRIEDLGRLADRIAREMQHMAVQLRPPALDSLGLQVALQSHLEEWSERHGVEADFHGAGLDGDRLPPEVETTIYRVVQEGLTNVLKHAQASCVSLVLERRGGSVRAILEDDGKGFDVEATLASPEKAKRLGLRGMRERVALLGGELEVESSPGSGTTVFVRLPDPAGAGREGGR